MLARTGRTILLVMMLGTVSVASLTLPLARAVVSAMPVSQAETFSCSGLREVIARSHAGFGDVAADVTCAYLKQLSAPHAAASQPREQAKQGRMEVKPECTRYALVSER